MQYEGVFYHLSVDYPGPARPERTEERGNPHIFEPDAPVDGGKGCGYSLRLTPGRETEAVALLRENTVPFSRLYLRKEDGTLEVRRL